jgi:hypothetical protein
VVAVTLDALLAPYVGMRIVGGCDDCDAYQEVRPGPADRPEVWHITVHHDDDCLTYVGFLCHELARLRLDWEDSRDDPARREEIKARGLTVKARLSQANPLCFEQVRLRGEWDDNEHNPQRRAAIQARYEEIKHELAKGAQ